MSEQCPLIKRTCILNDSQSKTQTCEPVDSNTEKHTKGSPTPAGQRFLELLDKWRKQEGVSGTGTPIEIQNEAWDIAMHPTEARQLLSRTGKRLGISVPSEQVQRIPSFLK